MTLTRHKPLKAHRGLNQISPQHLRELNGEVPKRIALCERCGGMPIFREYPVLVNGQRAVLKTVTCLGGVCEICGEPAAGQMLEPHERKYRSQGGKLSLSNSVMAHRICHMREQGEHVVVSHPMWGVDKSLIKL